MPNSREAGASSKPWDAPVTVVIPYLNTPDWLQLSVEMWQRQRLRPFVHIIETASAHPDSEAVLRLLSQRPLTEVARLGAGPIQHASDAICHAMDYAFSRCPTEYLIATHVDLIPKHRDLVAFLLSQCGPERPVVGWEMSPRGKGPRGTIDGTVSDGYPGHVCTIYHMPTMDRIGAGWSIRRSANAFGSSRLAEPDILGWPDTETCLGNILKERGIEPYYLGRETNDENQETEHWIHARSRTMLGMTPRHRTAFEIASKLLFSWRQEDGEDLVPRAVVDEEAVPAATAPPEPCSYRVTSGDSSYCGLAATLADASITDCPVTARQCRICRRASAPETLSVNALVTKLVFQAVQRKLQEAQSAGEPYEHWSAVRKQFARRVLHCL